METANQKKRNSENSLKLIRGPSERKKERETERQKEGRKGKEIKDKKRKNLLYPCIYLCMRSASSVLSKRHGREALRPYFCFGLWPKALYSMSQWAHFTYAVKAVLRSTGHSTDWLLAESKTKENQWKAKKSPKKRHGTVEKEWRPQIQKNPKTQKNI